MSTLDAILKEIKDVPADRLDDVYQYVHSLVIKDKVSKEGKKNLLEFSGILSDMSDEDYQDFTNHLKEVRKKLFNRHVDL